MVTPDTRGQPLRTVDPQRLPEAYRNDINQLLITEEEIHSRTSELARDISKDYSGPRRRDLVAIVVLDGGLIFGAELLMNPQFSGPWKLQTTSLKSYVGTQSTMGGELRGTFASRDIVGQDILVIEDIIDTGNAMRRILSQLLLFCPASLQVATLLDKPARRKDPFVDNYLKYTGFTIDPHFVVGHGLDYDDKYRSLRDICILEPRAYEK